MKNLILIILITMLAACNKSDNNEQFMYSLDVEISVKNSAGIDMLNPDNKNSLKEEDIKLFYVINGETLEVFDSHMDAPRNFFIFQHESEYRIRIFVNDAKTEAFPVTYIKWNESDIDTLKCVIERRKNITNCTKVWFNNELKCENPFPGTERYFEIIK